MKPSTDQWRIQDFPEEGAPTLKEAIIWPFFSQKLHEIERIWNPGGARIPGAPLRSANVDDSYLGSWRDGRGLMVDHYVVAVFC